MLVVSQKDVIFRLAYQIVKQLRKHSLIWVVFRFRKSNTKKATPIKRNKHVNSREYTTSIVNNAKPSIAQAHYFVRLPH